MGIGMLKRIPRLLVVLVALSVAACGGGGGGGGDNNTPPPPAAVILTSLAPAGVNAGAGATVVTATGSGFTAGSVIEWNGAPLATSYVSSTSVTATIPAADLTKPGAVAVTVSNTGGASSEVVNFSINEQTAPTVATLAPASLVAGGHAFVLAVNGANFQPNAVVLWNGTPLTTTFQSATVLTANVSAAQIASVGTASVGVENDTASGGTSNMATFVISSGLPVPTLASASPASIQQGQGGIIHLALTGTNFTPTSQVFLPGVSSFSSTYVSPTEIDVWFTTSIYSLSPANPLSITITDPASAFQVSNALLIPVIPPEPSVSSISPASVYADQGGLTLTVTGQFFTPTSVVYVNGTARPTSLNSNNSAELVAQLTALDVASAGTASISVQDTASGNVPSNAVTLTIQPLPALGLSSVSPMSVPVGNHAFTLTVSGNGFTANSVIDWNGTSVATTHVSVTTLTALISAAQVASVGTAQVTVVNPANEGGSSASQPVNIVAPSIDAVSAQINNGHTGSINFRSASLPASAAWSVNVGGTPSYALIVSNRVFVMSVAANAYNALNGSHLYALDAATGATVWGPIAFNGVAGVGYDNGMLFVNSGYSLQPSLLTALDAATGATKWSATIPGEFATLAPPVGYQGKVYALANGEVTAYDETSGAILWGAGVTGSDGMVAATVDGVYIAQPCTAVDYQPVTGATIWSINTGCVGGGGDTPVASGERVYAPIGFNYGGNIYDAESGNLLGQFGYGVLPAVTATNAYVMSYPGSSTLEGISLGNNQVNWSFAGDGHLNTAPIVVNNYVFIGSTSGNLYGLDAASGAVLWTQNLGAAIPTTSWSTSQGPTGLSAGDGLLVVPAGNTVTAFVLSTNP